MIPRASRARTMGLVAFGVCLLALLWSLKSIRSPENSTPEAPKAEPKAPFPGAVSVPNRSAALPLVRHAEEYLKQHDARLTELVVSVLPRVLQNRRQTAPDLEAIRKFNLQQQLSFDQSHAPARLRLRALTPAQDRQVARATQEMADLARCRNLLQQLASPEVVGDRSLGELTRDLIANTQYFDALKAGLRKTALTQAGDPELAERLQAMATGQQLIDALPEMANSFDATLTRVEKELPNETAAIFLRELSYSQEVDMTARYYARSWSSEVEAAESEYNTIVGDLYDLIQALPNDSETRVKLASRLKEAQLRNRANYPPKAGMP